MEPAQLPSGGLLIRGGSHGDQQKAGARELHIAMNLLGPSLAAALLHLCPVPKKSLGPWH